MKILLVTAEFGELGGGLSIACTRYFSLLKNDLNHDVEVLSSTINFNVTASGGYDPNLINKISHEYRLNFYINKYKDNNIDLVIAFGCGFNGYFASILSEKIKKNYILLFRGTDANLSKWNGQECIYTQYSVERASVIVCLSEEMKDNICLMAKDYDHKIVVIPNSISWEPTNITFPNLPDKLVLGTAASHINEKKGISNLLYMVYEFKKISPLPLALTIVGRIDEDIKKSYLDTIYKLELSNNVIFIEYQSRDAYKELTKTWDFYIQGSVCEGFGNAVSEAMSKGKGVILSSTGYLAESLNENHSWLIFKDMLPLNMAKHLNSVVNMQNKEANYLSAYKYIALRANKELVIKKWKNIISPIKIEDSCKREYGILSIALHEVDGTTNDHITTPISTFTKFVEDLHKKGYSICSMKKFLQKKEIERKRSIVCTFDDGYSTLVQNVVPILEKYHFCATVFINTNMIGKDNSWNWKDTKVRRHLDKNELMTLYNSGWEIGSHGNSHKNILRLTEQELIEELSESKQILEDLFGEVISYAYPYGDSSPYTRQICSQFYRFAFSLNQGGTELSIDNMQIRRYSIDNIYKILGI